MNYLGIEIKKLHPIVKSMNKLLSDYHVYYQNLRTFHWHVQGKHFFDLHNIFEDLYNEAKLDIDEVAERILTLRHLPLSNMSDYLNQSDIEEAKYQMNDEEMISTILKNHAILISSMRETIAAAGKVSDEGTIDLIAGLLAKVEKKSWKMEAWNARHFQTQSNGSVNQMVNV